MTIRFATTADVSAVVEMPPGLLAPTRFADMPFAADRLAKSLAAILDDKTGRYAFLLAEAANGTLVGVLIAVIERHIFSDILIANVMSFAVLPEHRMGGYGVRLLRAFERWAKNRGVAEFVFGVNSGGDFQRVGRFARRMGYRKIGENYAIGLLAEGRGPGPASVESKVHV